MRLFLSAVPSIRRPEGNQSSGHYWKPHEHSSASPSPSYQGHGKKTASLHLLRKTWPPGELVDVRCSLEPLQSVYINQPFLPRVRSARYSWQLAFGGWFEEHVFLCSSIVLPSILQSWEHLFPLWMGPWRFSSADQKELVDLVCFLSILSQCPIAKACSFLSLRKFTV